MIMLLLAVPVCATEILVWDHDNGAVNQDPEGAGEVGCEYAIEQSLLANGYDYITLEYLPFDLSGYDLIFITLGHWNPC